MILPFIKRLSITILGVHILFIIYVAFSSFYLKWANPTMSLYMCARANFDINQVSIPKFIPKDAVPNDIQTAIIGVEDPTFQQHNGYAQTDHPLTDATISQKVARNMFLMPHQNNLGKYLETIGAVGMECILDKDRIFELYLNYVEWGDNIYGIGEAADFYYKKDLRYLSRTQKLKLASVLSNPVEIEPSTYNTDKIIEARFNLLNRFMQ
ncbi:transglycosylase domain-containing protein [Flammeovirga agarivorans]|uniref:Glycosyl transferase family 51 domain-containing protein n=1 Tax=Flammeovirga agarivorans TaxID=2726742 RepID=A0A7X8SQP7_9BACT|nr:transglycosylase domain-containing protein [Flammeovirga agarivorans]NLR94649.1 hypothetical protein [Flammeovirga agarivorans]